MNCNKRKQPDIYATWKAARAWIKSLPLKQKSAEQRRRHLVAMDEALAKQMYHTTITVEPEKRLLTWKRVADVCVLGMCLGVMAYAAFEIASVFFKK